MQSLSAVCDNVHLPRCGTYVSKSSSKVLRGIKKTWLGNWSFGKTSLKVKGGRNKKGKYFFKVTANIMLYVLITFRRLLCHLHICIT